jgi:large subunit ribosomal protein L24
MIMTRLNPKHLHLPKHERDKMLGGVLEDSLRDQYGRKGVRVIKGDSVRVVRGEYKGVEGKIEKVDTRHATFHIEGIQREKIRGGQVKIPIHSSNVIVIALNLEDKHRSKKLQARVDTELISSNEKNAKEKTETEDDKE